MNGSGSAGDGDDVFFGIDFGIKLMIVSCEIDDPEFCFLFGDCIREFGKINAIVGVTNEFKDRYTRIVDDFFG